MLSMPFAARSSSGLSAASPVTGRARAHALALLAALVTAVTPAVTLADTGEPSTPGYTGDVTNRAQVVEAGQAPPPGDPADEYPDTDPSALNDFRDTLDPHGTWSQDPTYGTIWVPNQSEVGADFAPYQTAGQWSVADSGDWMWNSDYDWGYVPFHYGRWVWTGATWGWIPGRTYAPAWVTWRVGEGGYIGWAPLPPSWYWSDGLAVGLWSIPYAAYCFVPTTHVFYNHVSNHVVRDRAAVHLAAQGTRPYQPATPSVGHGGQGGHVSPAGSPQHRPSSPSFAAAHVPPTAVPQRRATADARAMSYATRSATAASHRSAFASPGRGSVGGAGRATPQASRGNAWNRSYDSFGRSSGASAGRAGDGGQRSAPIYSSTRAGRAGEAGGASSFRTAPSQGAHTAPGLPSRAGRGGAPPSFHGSQPGNAGHVSAPPSFQRSAPSPSFHAPSVSHSSSSHTTSRPSAPRSSGGGGRRR